MTYRWVDHTAELELHIAAPDQAAVFAEALQAFRDLIGTETAGEFLSLDVDVDAADRATLLVRWLEELVFRAETEDFVPQQVERLVLGKHGLTATVRGHRGAPRHLVKGVTYHGLAFDPADGGYRARVVLDV